MNLRLWLEAICLCTTACVLVCHSQSPAQSHKPMPRDSYGFEAVEIRLEHQKETWTIRRENGGIAVVVKAASGERIVRPTEFQGIGNPIRVAATKLEYKVDSGVYFRFVGLAIECEQVNRKSLEYRMALCQSHYGPEEWSLSEPLAVRAADNPFHTMGVGLPGGDSIMMTLQSLKRGAEKDKIETELFVNHCPIGTPMSGAPLQHYRFNPVVNVIPTSAPTITTKPASD